MTQKKITVDISPDGASKVETFGFNGIGCKAASRDIELALAGDFSGDISDKPKSDFFALNPGTNQQTN